MAAFHPHSERMTGEPYSLPDPARLMRQGYFGLANSPARDVLLFIDDDVYSPRSTLAANTLPRPFAVDYAVHLSTALAYKPDRSVAIERETGTHSIIQSVVAFVGGIVANTFTTHRMGCTWQYYDALRSDGYLLAGSTASGQVFRDVIGTIGIAVEQLLGQEIPVSDLARSSDHFSVHGDIRPSNVRIVDWAPRRRQRSPLEIAVLGLDIDNVPQDAREIGASALCDVLILLGRTNLRENGTASISDDGIVTLRWHSDKKGALLVFSGDGTVTFAAREDDQLYGMNHREYSIETGLPQSAIETINEIF
jgi:hypothetical protein